MKNKNNKRANKIIRDMKECFQSFHLPIKEAQPGDAYTASCDFLSEISNENVQALITVEYNRYHEIININIPTRLHISPGRINEGLKLLNLLNGMLPLYQYSICPCCNEVSVHVGLHVSGNRLSKDKFKGLIRSLLEDTYLFCPLIARMLIAGGNPEELYDRFMDDHKDLMSKENKLTSKMEGKILDDVKLMFSDFDIAINDDDRVDRGFIMQFVHPKDPGLFLRVGTILDSENGIVFISMSPPFPVPDDKLDVMMELVNRINRICGTDHMYITGERKNVVLLKGVMLDNGVLDKEELKNAFGALLSNGFQMFPIINEQLTSVEIPETLMRKVIPCYSDKTTTH